MRTSNAPQVAVNDIGGPEEFLAAVDETIKYFNDGDIVEGTVYALLIRIEQRGLVDVAKVPSEKGPPRKVYSLNALGGQHLDEFWRTWSFLVERIEQLHHHIEHPQEEGE